MSTGPRFDTFQLDDQKVGLLLESINSTSTEVNYLASFRDAMKLLFKGVQRERVTSHNYRTMLSFINFIDTVNPRLSRKQRDFMIHHLGKLKILIQDKHSAQDKGFVKNSMANALEAISSSIQCLGEI